MARDGAYGTPWGENVVGAIVVALLIRYRSASNG